MKCACFRMTARYLKFKPRDGVAVIARGRLDVYDARGEYQLLVEHLEPQGYGALQFAFEQLKKKLTAEGLFDPARKRPLPRYPQRIGIVTSPQGAVIQDMLNILSRRFPGLHSACIRRKCRARAPSTGVPRHTVVLGIGMGRVVIVARGGGSLEDLWTFNEEEVARAIAAVPFRWSRPSDMKPTSPSPTSSPTCGRRPLRQPLNWSFVRASRSRLHHGVQTDARTTDSIPDQLVREAASRPRCRPRQPLSTVPLDGAFSASMNWNVVRAMPCAAASSKAVRICRRKTWPFAGWTFAYGYRKLASVIRIFRDDCKQQWRRCSRTFVRGWTLLAHSCRI